MTYRQGMRHMQATWQTLMMEMHLANGTNPPHTHGTPRCHSQNLAPPPLSVTKSGGDGGLLEAGYRARSFPVGVYNPFRIQGERRILAASSKQQAQKNRVFQGTPASKQLQTTAEQMRITRNKIRMISSGLACFVAKLVSKNNCFQPVFTMIVLKVQNQVCQVGNEGCSFFTAIGLSNNCK